MKRIIINNEETDYSIDKEGKIFSNKTNKFLLGSVYNTGYRMVRLTIGKNKKAMQFIVWLQKLFYQIQINWPQSITKMEIN